MKALTKIVLFLFIGLQMVSAQTDSTKSSQHYIGFNTGFTTGVGPSYRLDHNGLRFTATFLPLMSQEYSWLSAGGSIGYSSLNWEEDFDFYPYLGVSYLNTSKTEYRYELNGDPIEYFIAEEKLNIGLGVSFDKHFSKYFTASLKGGYAAYLSTNRTPAYFLTGEVAIFYRFGKF